jgi:hypothetical protein
MPNLLRSVWSARASFSDVIVRYAMVSSAKILTVDFRHYGISLI